MLDTDVRHWSKRIPAGQTIGTTTLASDLGVASDSPAIALDGAVEGSMKDEFRTYFLFQSSKAESSWVTRGRLDLVCNASTKLDRRTGGWSKPILVGMTPNPGGTPSSELPEWFDNVRIPTVGRQEGAAMSDDAWSRVAGSGAVPSRVFFELLAGPLASVAHELHVAESVFLLALAGHRSRWLDADALRRRDPFEISGGEPWASLALGIEAWSAAEGREPRGARTWSAFTRRLARRNPSVPGPQALATARRWAQRYGFLAHQQCGVLVLVASHDGARQRG